MKSTLITVFLCTLLLGFTKTEKVSKKENRIEVVFKSDFTIDSLVNIKNRLFKRNNIAINYRSLRFNKAGNLIEIEFSVNCNDGFKGTASIEELSNKPKFGFIRDYQSTNGIPFQIGGLN